MTKIIALLLLCAASAQASNSYDNSTVLNAVSISTTSSPFNRVIDLASADSASWQYSVTCAKGQLKIQQSNDGVSFVDLNVAGSSIAFAGGGLTTSSNNLFAIASPAYRYVNFNVVNSSVPAAGVAAACTATVKQLLKTLTPKVN